MAELAAAMVTLANVSTMQLANNLSKVKAVQKPSPFKGEHSSDACHFLTAFTMWAMAQGTALNVVDQQGNAVKCHDMEWIRAALLYLQEDASIWGSPAMEEFVNGGVPFGSSWGTFCDQFKARFKTVDKAVDAKEKLRILRQDSSMVPEYTALFKELMARTGYSSLDLCDRFYEHLTVSIKDKLVHTACPIGTLEELITIASDIDIQVRQCCTERERERKHSRVMTGTMATQTQAPLPNNPFISPGTEPAPMDVDATHTREEFMCQMRGKCFGCGSTVHAKRDGNHDHNLCVYCKHVRHRELVCMDKFLGKPKGQKAAATMKGKEGEMELEPEEISEMLEVEEMVSASTTTTMLAQLVEHQKALAEQIAALRDQDF
jgi:Retrotransposon gag protein